MRERVKHELIQLVQLVRVHLSSPVNLAWTVPYGYTSGRSFV
jgi:hypothetical protein